MTDTPRRRRRLNRCWLTAICCTGSQHCILEGYHLRSIFCVCMCAPHSPRTYRRPLARFLERSFWGKAAEAGQYAGPGSSRSSHERREMDLLRWFYYMPQCCTPPNRAPVLPPLWSAHTRVQLTPSPLERDGYRGTDPKMVRFTDKVFKYILYYFYDVWTIKNC